MATISKLRLKPEWEKWMLEHSHQSFSAPTPGEVTRSDRVTSQGVEPRVFNEVLWQAVKREWRRRMAAQLPQAGQDDQGQD